MNRQQQELREWMDQDEQRQYGLPIVLIHIVVGKLPIYVDYQAVETIIRSEWFQYTRVKSSSNHLVILTTSER